MITKLTCTINNKLLFLAAAFNAARLLPAALSSACGAGGNAKLMRRRTASSAKLDRRRDELLRRSPFGSRMSDSLQYTIVIYSFVGV
jgi:hypothetical protein